MPPPPPSPEEPSLFSRWKSSALSPLQPGIRPTLRAGAQPEALPKEACCQKTQTLRHRPDTEPGNTQKSTPPRVTSPRVPAPIKAGRAQSAPPTRILLATPAWLFPSAQEKLKGSWPRILLPPPPRTHPGLAAHLALQGCQSSCAPKRTFASCSIWTAAGSVMLRRECLITEWGVW